MNNEVNVVLDADKLQKDSPEFPKTCIVCRKPCADEENKAFNALSGKFGVGVEFVRTRNFPIPMHTTTDACAKVFTRTWKVERYRGLVLISLATILWIASIPFLHEKGVFVLYGSIAAFFVLNVYLSAKSNLPLRILETVSFKSSRNYTFVFKDETYGSEFRRLNQRLLAD